MFSMIRRGQSTLTSVLLLASTWGGDEAAAKLEALHPQIPRWQIREAFDMLSNVVDFDMK